MANKSRIGGNGIAATSDMESIMPIAQLDGNLSSTDRDRPDDRAAAPGHSGESSGNGIPAGDQTSAMDPLLVAQRAIETRSRQFGQPDDPCSKRYPCLWRLLCKGEDLDGSPWQPGRLSVSPRPASFIWTLTHDDWGYSISAEVPWLQDGFKALEELIKAPDAPWKETTRGKGWQKRKDEERKRLDLKRTKR